jgi:response regulator NasT
VRILPADDDTTRARALTPVLSADRRLARPRREPGELLADAVAAPAPDVVLVDMARPDRDALENSRADIAGVPRPSVLLVDHDDVAFTVDAIRASVSLFNVPDAPPPDIGPIPREAAALFRQHQAARTEQREAALSIAAREGDRS